MTTIAEKFQKIMEIAPSQETAQLLQLLSDDYIDLPRAISSQQYLWQHKDLGPLGLKWAQGDMQRSFLEHEAQFIRAHQHPVFPEFVDIKHHGKTSVLITRWFEGASLAQLSKEKRTISFDWLAQLEQGLVYCHQHGFNHGDIKPANILIGSDQVKLINFNSVIKHGECYQQQALHQNSGFASLEALSADGVAKPQQDWYSLAVTLIASQQTHPAFVATQSRFDANSNVCVPTKYLQIIRQEYKRVLKHS